MPFARPIVARTAAALDRSGRWAAAAESGYLLGVGVPSALRFSLISMRSRSDCERVVPVILSYSLIRACRKLYADASTGSLSPCDSPQ